MISDCEIWITSVSFCWRFFPVLFVVARLSDVALKMKVSDNDVTLYVACCDVMFCEEPVLHRPMLQLKNPLFRDPSSLSLAHSFDCPWRIENE